MAKGVRYREEFKRDAVAQVVDRGYSAAEVSRLLGVSTKSVYDWVKRYGKAEPKHVAKAPGAIISLLHDYDAPSNMRRSTCTPTRMFQRRELRSVNI